MHSSSSNSASARSAVGALISDMRSELRNHAHTYLLIALLFVATVANAQYVGEEILPLLARYTQRILRAIILVAGAVFVVAAISAILKGERSPLSFVVARIRSTLATLDVGRIALGSIAFVLFMAVFLFHKMRIPDYVPFHWDDEFTRWDAVLFGGVHPWQLLHPILGYPLVTQAIDFAYTGWAALMPVFWIGVMVSPRVSGALRRQYWLSTIVAWIVVGLIMATLLSSAGPCYYPLVVPGGQDPYADLNAYLAGVHESYGLSSTLAKDYLWAIHADLLDEAGGISAMPSMHNAQAALFAALAYRINRRFGHVMAVYAAVIFIGSIHLGWHYAIDGIVGVAAALVIWWVVGLSIAKPACAKLWSIGPKSRIRFSGSSDAQTKR